MSKRPPRDERSQLNLPKPPPAPEVRERDTLRSEGSSGALEAIGKRHEGMDGKRYLGSFAVHIYEVDKISASKEYVYAFHSTDLSKIPENIAAMSLPELGKAVMVRYGRKIPAKTTDKYTKTSEQKV